MKLKRAWSGAGQHDPLNRGRYPTRSRIFKLQAGVLDHALGERFPHQGAV
jgi:hypothetical protein